MNYIRPQHDFKYYLFFFLLYLSCIIAYWSHSYIDYKNMINNGYIDKGAISFTIDDETTLNRNGDYLLFQYNPEHREVKYISYNGEFKLPPIKNINNSYSIDELDNVAIAGDNYNVNKIPSNYTLIGYFDTPESYKLNSEVWLFSNSNKIDASVENIYVFLTPHQSPYKIFKKVINSKSVNIIDQQAVGTYSLGSNKMFIYFLNMYIIFIITTFSAISLIWLNKEKYLINILHLSGLTTLTINKQLIKYKVLPHILITLFLIIGSIIFDIFVYPLWSNKWIIFTIITMLSFNISLLVITFIIVKLNSTKKRGKDC